MKKVDFFTGDTALEVVSPPISEAESMASFGMYNYGGPPVPINNMGYGYNGSPYQQGIGYNNPYNYGYYQQPGYTQYGYGYGGPGTGNPAFGNSNFMQPQAEDIHVNIPPLNPWGSEYLPPDQYEDKIFDLQWKYWWDYQTSNAEQAIDRQNQFGYGYPNYYCNYYSTPYNYNYFNGNKYIEQLNDMQDRARQARIDLNINLSKLAHNLLGDEYDEQELVEKYTGKTVTVPGMTTLDVYEANRFANLVPFDNSQAYRDHDAQVSAEFKKRIGGGTDMKSCFENLALVRYDYAMEEELHRRRRDLKSSYDSNTYKTLIRQKVFNDKVAKEGMKVSNQVQDMKDNLLGSGMFPTLSQHARLADDGTLNITYSYDGNTVNNLNESEYQKERERFNSFLNSIPGMLNRGG